MLICTWLETDHLIHYTACKALANTLVELSAFLRRDTRCMASRAYVHECHVLALLNSGPLTSAGGSSRFTWIRIADLVPTGLNTVHKVVQTRLDACAHGNDGDGLLTRIRKPRPFSRY